MSLADLLNAEASTSVTDVDGRHSMTEVDAAAEELAKSLREVGVQAGQAVGVSLPNTVDVVTALFAVWKVGGVYVPINPRLTPTEVEHLVEAVDPMALVDVDGVSGRSSGRVYEA
ncbi:MAG: AMP-binding protein, partial [Acidobacteria bacterium]|nr:AMP-binding protein [Acidobacteriota bacterium]